MRFLVYFADPLCSWCYGFGPELATFLAGTPGIRCDVVMGGACEPACRAVVTVRTLDSALALPYLAAVQSAFHAQGRDATSAEVLADVAQEAGVDRAAFLAAFESQAMKDETGVDFGTAQQMGVKGFPTLAVGYESKQFFLLANGFTRADVLAGRLEEIDALAARGPVPLPDELQTQVDHARKRG